MFLVYFVMVRGYNTAANFETSVTTRSSVMAYFMHYFLTRWPWPITFQPKLP